MSQAITKVGIQGDLSPKQSGKMKEKYNKPKKLISRRGGGEDSTVIEAALRQSKRMIVKNPKYL